MIFPSPCGWILGNYLQTDHDRHIPHPFQLIILSYPPIPRHITYSVLRMHPHLHEETIITWKSYKCQSFSLLNTTYEIQRSEALLCIWTLRRSGKKFISPPYESYIVKLTIHDLWMLVFWVVTPCLHQPWRWRQYVFCETFESTYKSTQRCNQEYLHRHLHRRQNLKFLHEFSTS
jgi:hypothetical protein